MNRDLEQRDAALILANVKRSRIAEIRRDLRNGTLSLRDVLLDPPAEIHNWPIADLIRLGYAKRSTAALEHLGRRALVAHINLLCPVGRASLRTRSWVAENVVWLRAPQSGGIRTTLLVVS